MTQKCHQDDEHFGHTIFHYLETSPFLFNEFDFTPPPKIRFLYTDDFFFRFSFRFLFCLIINIFIIRDRGQPQREQQIHVKWKCCSLCVWLVRVSNYTYINNKRQKPTTEEHSNGVLCSHCDIYLLNLLVCALPGPRSVVVGCCVVTVTFIY